MSPCCGDSSLLVGRVVLRSTFTKMHQLARPKYWPLELEGGMNTLPESNSTYVIFCEQNNASHLFLVDALHHGGEAE